MDHTHKMQYHNNSSHLPRCSHACVEQLVESSARRRRWYWCACVWQAHTAWRSVCPLFGVSTRERTFGSRPAPVISRMSAMQSPDPEADRPLSTHASRVPSGMLPLRLARTSWEQPISCAARLLLIVGQLQPGHGYLGHAAPDHPNSSAAASERSMMRWPRGMQSFTCTTMERPFLIFETRTCSQRNEASGGKGVAGEDLARAGAAQTGAGRYQEAMPTTGGPAA